MVCNIRGCGDTCTCMCHLQHILSIQVKGIVAHQHRGKTECAEENGNRTTGKNVEKI